MDFLIFNENNKENETTTTNLVPSKLPQQQTPLFPEITRIPLQNIHNSDSLLKRSVSFSPSTVESFKPSNYKRKKSSQPSPTQFTFTSTSSLIEYFKVNEILNEDQIKEINNDDSLDFISLFKMMEDKGFLFYDVLEVFSNCPQLKHFLTTLQLSKTFSESKKELFLNSSPSKLMHANEFDNEHLLLPITKPLFNGRAWRSLEILDLSFLSTVRDEELRYIIRLPNIIALGLSMTRVTSRGIRYLGKHSLFKDKLQCLKLCHLEEIDDRCIKEFSQFPSLNEVDLYGCNSKSLTFSSLLEIDKRIIRIRLPLKHMTYLEDMHNIYRGIMHTDGDDGYHHKIPNSQGDIRNQLRLYQKHYTDIFLNLDIISHEAKLKMILERRSKEEDLYQRINK